MASPVVSVSSASPMDSPDFLSAEYVVPVLVLIFVALNVGNDEKYAELRKGIVTLLQNPRQILPEALGLAFVGIAVASGLLLSPSGHRAGSAELEALRAQDEYTFGLRRLWPTLLHADSLLVIQQLLMGLAAMLLLARGACAHSSSSLTLALVLLAMAQGLRAQQWMEGENYTPEGPIGHQFAGMCACASSLMVLAAALRSVQSVLASGRHAVRGTANLILILALCAWLANENHLAASNSKRPDLTYAFIHMVEMCAAPLFLVAACSAAERVANLGGAFVVMALAQAASVWWFLDFAGALQDPNSHDSLVQHDLKIKNTLRTYQQGHAHVVFAVSHVVRTLCTAGACVAYAVLRLSRPDAVPKAAARSVMVVEV